MNILKVANSACSIITIIFISNVYWLNVLFGRVQVTFRNYLQDRSILWHSTFISYGQFPVLLSHSQAHKSFDECAICMHPKQLYVQAHLRRGQLLNINVPWSLVLRDFSFWIEVGSASLSKTKNPHDVIQMQVVSGPCKKTQDLQ